MVGDLIYKKRNDNKKLDGHVEFYIGNDKVVSWGKVYKDYIIRKKFELKNDGYFYSSFFPRTAVYSISGK